MSKGNQQQSNPVPTTPKPQSSYTYQNDMLRSQSVFDKGKNAYINTSFSTPQEQSIEKGATDYMGKLVNDIPNAVNLSPEAIAGYRQAYEAPQISALNDSYNQAKGQATQAAAGHGMLNSVGFGNYTANQLEKNRAQGLADIAANGKMMEYDLPNKLLTPYVNQFNLYNAAAQGQQANMGQNLDPSLQTSVNANNIANQSFQNQLNAWNAKNQQSQSRGGLFSFFTGGV